MIDTTIIADWMRNTTKNKTFLKAIFYLIFQVIILSEIVFAFVFLVSFHCDNV